MNKLTSIILVVFMVLTLTSCTGDDAQFQPSTEAPAQTQSTMPTESPSQTQGNTPTAYPSEPTPEETEAPDTQEVFEGKIAIITYAASDITWYSAFPVISKYGGDKVVHVECPLSYMFEHEKMVDLVMELGADPDIKAIIVNRTYIGMSAAFEKLRETRKDIFVVYCTPDTDESSAESTQTRAIVAQTADLVLATDELGMGPAMAKQAQKLGAKTFVHYSFPRHMSVPILLEMRELAKRECEELGIEFVGVTAIDPLSEAGRDSANEFILDDVPKMVKKYGKDTAFFTTDSILKASLIPSVVSEGAIFPYPSPYGFTSVFQMEEELRNRWADPSCSRIDIDRDVISGLTKAIAKKNMLGRLSTWPVEADHMYTMTAAEYAVKWINGEVSKDNIDIEILKQLMEEYAGVEVYLTPYTDDYPYTENGTGETYNNFLMMRMDYFTFE